MCPNHGSGSRLGRDSRETKSVVANLEVFLQFWFDCLNFQFKCGPKIWIWRRKYLQTVVCTQIQPISASAATLPYPSPSSRVTHLWAVSRSVSVNVYVCSCETVYWINFKRDSNAVQKRQDDLKGCLSYVLLQKLDSRDITLRSLPVTPPYYAFLYRFRKTV